MTDLLNTNLQALGVKIATNLTTKGVTSSASEGLTTLANKILDVVKKIVYYDDCTGSNSPWDYKTGTYSYSDNELKMNKNAYIGHSIDNPTEITLEYDFYTSYSWNWQYTIFQDANHSELGRCLASSSYDVGSGILTCKSIGYNKWFHIKVTFKSNGEAYMWIDDTLKASTDNHGLTWSNVKYIVWHNSQSSNERYKNITLTILPN